MSAIGTSNNKKWVGSTADKGQRVSYRHKSLLDIKKDNWQNEEKKKVIVGTKGVR